MRPGADTSAELCRSAYCHRRSSEGSRCPTAIIQKLRIRRTTSWVTVFFWHLSLWHTISSGIVGVCLQHLALIDSVFNSCQASRRLNSGLTPDLNRTICATNVARSNGLYCPHTCEAYVVTKNHLRTALPTMLTRRRVECIPAPDRVDQVIQHDERKASRTNQPTNAPTHRPTDPPTHRPTDPPTHRPTDAPTHKRTQQRSFVIGDCDTATLRHCDTATLRQNENERRSRGKPNRC